MRALCILSVLTLLSCGTRAAMPTASTRVEQAGDPCVVGPRVISAPRANGTAPVMASGRDQFAVVWEEAGEARRELRIQMFDARGQPQAPSRALDALSSGGGDPQIATTENGYAVVWSVDHGDTTDVMLERSGRMADGAVLGDDSVLCRVQRGSSQAGAADEELLCAREKAGGLLRERVLARSAHTLGVAHVADTSESFAVALEGARPADEDTEAVLVTVVQCND